MKVRPLITLAVVLAASVTPGMAQQGSQTEETRNLFETAGRYSAQNTEGRLP